NIGEAVGVIAAQSIGEPGTQLTMRTFHLGGVAAVAMNPEIITEHEGVLVYHGIRCVYNEEGFWIALNKSGTLNVVKDEGRSLEEYKRLLSTNSLEPMQSFNIELGTRILFQDGQKIKKKIKVAEFEQHNIPIICDRPGYVRFEDLVEGISAEKQTNRQTGQEELTVKQHRGELHPQIAIYNDRDCVELVGTYPLPVGAIISVHENVFATAGSLLARLPRGALKTKDITGGLPRVAELFEARKPKNSAEIAKIDGFVDFLGVQRSKRVVFVRDPVSGMEEEHLVPLSKHLIVQKGDHVVKGQQLTDGVVIPHEILEVCGVRELYSYLVRQVQEVYRLQGVRINDKHIEIIVRQMLKKVRIVEPGDSSFILGEEVDKSDFELENLKVVNEGGKAATGAPVLLGITKASLSTDSFISAASFQDTTRVLTDAACAGKVDPLMGYKENTITGSMMPGGTGHALKRERHRHVEEASLSAVIYEFESVTGRERELEEVEQA
ncbi:MAG: DNA-directed RNA polymerase subunit beta', partial [Chlamydiia bacterium]|nr:DNA-directed RNA polymerase subunit beta' [Chlamydiia bacterium]